MIDLAQVLPMLENIDDNLSILESTIIKQQCGIDKLGIVDTDFLKEIESITREGKIHVYFGKTLKDLKLVLRDDDEVREHELYFQYNGPRNLCLSAVKLPSSCLQHRDFTCVEDIVDSYKKYINELSRFFFELEHIDECCTVVEPLNASFKDDYRRLLIDERIWLHVEVTPEGLATNIHLVGHSEHWNSKLQKGLLSWDHDKNIVDNIMNIFDLAEFPQLAANLSAHQIQTEGQALVEEIVCGICLCSDLPNAGVPQPLCQNPSCRVYYHRNCLYQWLVACAGSRPPAFGVANGECPTCLQPVTCSEKVN